MLLPGHDRVALSELADVRAEEQMAASAADEQLVVK
jgi:hypothetical protein